MSSSPASCMALATPPSPTILYGTKAEAPLSGSLIVPFMKQYSHFAVIPIIQALERFESGLIYQ